MSSREEWPVNRNNGNQDDNTSYRSNKKSKGLEESNFVSFIIKNIDDIISLFLNEKSANQNDLISDEILESLDFILEGSVDNMQTILPFSLMAKQPLVKSKMNDGNIYIKNLITFLKTYLEINPFGLNNCIRLNKRINPSYLAGSTDPRKSGKIITNKTMAPKNDFIISINQVIKHTLIEISEQFCNAGLYIDKCFYSYIYILQPLRSCVIKKCRKSILFIGPTQRTLTVDSCVECTIVSCCRRLIIRNCSMCTFYLLTPSRPILLNGCDSIKFAPFNSIYPNIDEDARKSELSNHGPNYWNNPIVISQNNQLISGTIHWSLMDPKEFSILTIPVEKMSSIKTQIKSKNLIIKANVSSLFF
jgi:TBCC domain-containing protein 1